MRLKALIQHLDPVPPSASLPDIDVTSVVEDSRQATPGSLFIARAGTKTDGSRFLADALARGSVAAVVTAPDPSSPLPQIVLPNPALAASVLANALAGNPSRVLKVLAVTGTNGKTTTAYLIRHILAKTGRKCGLVGTVEIDNGAKTYESDMTTPAAPYIANLLATMRDNGCSACAVETSSHALHQHRADGVSFAAAGFTNLTGDHLDYHGTMDAYAAAKARLFEMLPPGAPAVVNARDTWSPRMVQNTRGRVITYAIDNHGSANRELFDHVDYRAKDILVNAAGTHFMLHGPDGRVPIQLLLIGRHNIENALVAAAICIESFGLSVQQVAAALKDAIGAPGRLQQVRAGQPFTVLVDYAHTDDALENVLSALRPLTRGKLRVLFGCGGDRDKTKRPRMAKVAERLADVLYVTSDNPRTEDPNIILSQIVSGLSVDKGHEAVVEVDRQVAIERILADSLPGDVVLIAGKGHENYQIIGTEKKHFDDAEVAAGVLRSIAGTKRVE